jgi:hypothetical protein
VQCSFEKNKLSTCASFEPYSVDDHVARTKEGLHDQADARNSVSVAYNLSPH